MKNFDFAERQPVVALRSRVGYRIHFSAVVFTDEQPCLVMQVIPVLPCCNNQLADRGIVLDVFPLVCSIQKPGSHQLLNSDCGYPPDSGLYAAIQVSHPDDHTIVWEMDVVGLRPALNDEFENITEGFIRLIFSRDEYASDVCRLIRELQALAKKPIQIDGLTEDVFDLDVVRRSYSALKELHVGELEPNVRGCALEDLKQYVAGLT